MAPDEEKVKHYLEEHGFTVERFPKTETRAGKIPLDSTAKCNTDVERLEVRCASIVALTGKLELHDELYAPHPRGTVSDLVPAARGAVPAADREGPGA